jgi:hypothetical protein
MTDLLASTLMVWSAIRAGTSSPIAPAPHLTAIVIDVAVNFNRTSSPEPSLAQTPDRLFGVVVVAVGASKRTS